MNRSKIILPLIYTLVSTNALAEQDDCACKTEDIILAENLSIRQVIALEKKENDMFCILFESNRVDNKLKTDLAFCHKDENV